MNGVNKTDFSIYKNRCAVSEELMKQDYESLAKYLIRLCVFMECSHHPDRQTFWEYLENICKENRTGQLVLEQVLTQAQNATPNTETEKTVDRHLNKV